MLADGSLCPGGVTEDPGNLPAPVRPPVNGCPAKDAIASRLSEALVIPRNKPALVSFVLCSREQIGYLGSRRLVAVEGDAQACVRGPCKFVLL